MKPKSCAESHDRPSIALYCRFLPQFDAEPLRLLRHCHYWENLITVVITRPLSRHLLERLDRKRENIANAALGLDHARGTRTYFQFAAQSQDLNIDAPIEYICVNSRRLQQMFPRERPLRRFKKRDQQCILALAQRHLRLIGSYKSSAATLEPPATEFIAASFRI